MGGDRTYDVLFELKFIAKTLERQAKKARRDELREIDRMKKALAQGNESTARIFAENAIRLKNLALRLLRLSGRVAAAASQVETATAIHGATSGMNKAVRIMNALKGQRMDLDMITAVMDKIDADVGIQRDIVKAAVLDSNAVNAPVDEVDDLLKQTAKELRLENLLGPAPDSKPVPPLMLSPAQDASPELGKAISSAELDNGIAISTPKSDKDVKAPPESDVVDDLLQRLKDLRSS